MFPNACGGFTPSIIQLYYYNIELSVHIPHAIQ